MNSLDLLPMQLQQLRKNENLTSKEAAQLCNIHPSTWSLYETGKRIPSLNVFLKICEQFNISADKLLSLKK